MDATTNTLYIIDHCKNCHKMTHKWCNHLPSFCVLYRKESANKRYRKTVNNLISPNTVSQNDQKPHTAELDDTAIPHVKIEITEIKYRMKKAQYRNTVNPHVPLVQRFISQPRCQNLRSGSLCCKSIFTVNLPLNNA